MKIAAVCCTYLRPKQLGCLIRCFLEQDYDDRELLILDDAGQYANRRGDRWRLVSVGRRYPSLGEKRNAAVALASAGAEAFAVWDDDDVYLPWALSASVAALRKAPWSRPSLVLHERPDGKFRRHRTGGLYHGGWAYTRAAFARAGGYPALNNGEDQAFARRMKRAGAAEADPCRLGFQPFYVYRWQQGGGYHLSNMGTGGYRRLGRRAVRKTRLRITWPRDFRNVEILPGVHPRMF
ncbi:MAG: glycosyltransferase family 2 protein [Planctomycetes bacterium]|nr:glycosyltransferase family 2 protein [Planctomycetota bacterium]